MAIEKKLINKTYVELPPLARFLKPSFPTFYQTCQFSNEPAISNFVSDEGKAGGQKIFGKRSLPITELTPNLLPISRAFPGDFDFYKFHQNIEV